MPLLSLSFLGGFQAKLDGNPISHFRSSNAQGLLVYLALQAERPFPRDLLAALFWPDSPDAVAKKNLRQAVYQLRQLLPQNDIQTPYLDVTRQNIQFNAASHFELDVHAFLGALKRGDLETAVSHPTGLYHGELLAGFTCDSLEFEAWLRQERQHLHRLALEAMGDLAERQLARGKFSEAQATARRQLSLEPWQETAHRQLMRALALSGNRNAALAQFEQCCAVLDEELGVLPAPETAVLAKRIEANELTAPDPDLIGARFALGEQIGQGAMGIVYRGRDTQTGQSVAIKMLDRSRIANRPHMVERFRREGEALRQLNHPNIVNLLAAIEKGDNHYLIMEFIDGQDLRHFLSENQQPPLEKVLSIALDLADALTRAHRLHILHRDLKPANILLDKDGVPHLADFGIAQLGRDSELTEYGAVLGTIAYLSPEACLGESLDERADIWAFGLLLYEMLAGKRPFDRATPPATLIAIINDPLPEIGENRSNLPDAVVDLLHQMLAKDKSQRIPSVRQVGAALEAILKAVEGGIADELILNTPAVPTSATTISAATVSIAPFQAPNAPPHFVGREQALGELASLVDTHSVVALVGMGGIGKTSLVTAAAHHLRTTFADGVLWANTHTSQSSNILDLWGRAYDHDFSGLTDLASRETAVRSLLADKQALIVLDNVDNAADARSLLLQGTGGKLLLTTRNLDVASALNAHAYLVPELSAASSRSLFVQILGEARVLTMPEETAAADQIGTLLHHLPLAVEIAAQRLKSRPRMKLSALAQRLQNTQQRLGLAISDSAVRASFEVSWDVLDAGLQRLFAQIGSFSGRPFTADALATIGHRDLFSTEDDLFTLTALSLVQESGEMRYKQHPLLADFAAEKLGDDGEVNGRLARYYLTFAQNNQDVFEALDPEWENLSAAIEIAHNLKEWRLVLDLTEALGRSWFRYGRYHDANTAYALAETAAQKLQSDKALAHTLLCWAEITIEQSNYDAAWERLETALRLFYELEDGSSIVKTQRLRGLILFDQGEYENAKEILRQNQKLLAELKNTHEEALTTRLLARVYFETEETVALSEKLALKALEMQSIVDSSTELLPTLRLLSQIEIRKGNLSTAEDFITQAFELSEQTQNLAEKGASTYRLIEINIMRGDYDQAQSYAKDGLELVKRLGNLRSQGMILHYQSVICLRINEISQAKQITEQTLEIYRQIEDRLGYGYALRQLGDIFTKMNEPDNAKKCWLEAQQIANFLKNRYLSDQIEQRMDIANEPS